MGEVYRARDTRLGREVAVKVLPPAFASDPDRLRQFEYEARTVGGLNHPNLVTLFDVGTHEGGPYLVMELLEGETLRQKLAGKPISVKRAVEISSGVAEGLGAAHDKGIVHRDLKPENLFITREGRVKILDFGLAKPRRESQPSLIDELTTETFAGGESGTDTGVVVGTVGYMSPEQVRGQRLDARSDIFALGIVCWEMLTGSRPFKGSSAVESLNAILKDEPPDLDPALKVPDVLDRIVRTCLAKEPAGRFHSAHDLSFALSHLSALTASGFNSQPAVFGPARIRSWAFGVLLCVTVVAAATIGHVLWLPKQPQVFRLTPAARIISSANFLPDGKTVVYTASAGDSWSRFLGELFRLTPGEPPVPLGVRDCRVLDVSASGELLLIWRRENIGQDRDETRAVLARVPSTGGSSPRVMEEGRLIWDSAKWTRDGREVIERHIAYKGERSQALVYRGRPIYEVPWGFGIYDFIVGESGDSLDVIELRSTGRTFVRVGLDSKVIEKTPLQPLLPTRIFPFRGSLVALTDGDGRENPVQLVSLSRSGSFRKILQNLTGEAQLWDVNSGGETLMTMGGAGGTDDVRWLEPGSDRERLLELGNVESPVLNDAGSQLACDVNGDTETVALLQTGQSVAANLGEGRVLDQAADGKAVLIRVSDSDGYFRLRLVPTGAGSPRELPGKWVSTSSSFLLKEGVFVYGRQKDDTQDFPYFLENQSSSVRRLTWHAARFRGPISPDGRSAFGSITSLGVPVEGAWSMIDLASGSMTPLPSSCVDMIPRGWTARGDGIWLTKPFSKDLSFPTGLWLLDLRTRNVRKIRDIGGPELPLADMNSFRITPDGRSYAYATYYVLPVRKHLYRVSGLLQ